MSRLRRLSMILGAISCLAGLVTITGWVADLPSLVRLGAGFPPTQAGAGLGYFLVGLATMGAAARRTPILLLGAIPAAFLGLASLVSRFFGTPDLATLQWLFAPIADGTIRPGSMAPNTAVVFLLAGAALAFPQRSWRQETVTLVVELVGATLVLLALVDLGLFAVERSTAFSGLPSQMALPAALATLCVGAALFGLSDQPLWAPAARIRRTAGLVGMTGVAAILTMVTLQRADQRLKLTRAAEARAELVTQSVAARIRDLGLGLTALAAIAAADPATEPPAEPFRRAYPEFESTTAIRGDGTVIWSFTQAAVEEPRRIEAPAAATLGDTARVFWAPGLSLVAPMSDSAGHRLVAVLDVRALLEGALRPIEAGYRFTFRQQDHVLFATPGPPRIGDDAVTTTMAGFPWAIEVEPTAQLRSQLRGPFPVATLLLGTLLSFLVATSFQSDRLARAQSAKLGRTLGELQEETAQRERAEGALREGAARLEAAKRMEALTRMAGGVSHDFNNLLSIIKGNASLLAAGGTAADRDSVAAINRAADDAANLTWQLLTFSARHAAHQKLVDLNDTVRRMERPLGHIAGDLVVLDLDLAAEPLVVLADPAMLRDVLAGLATNAAEAMPDGGTLTITTRRERLDDAAAHEVNLAPGVYRCVEVADTGTGIAPEVAVHLFEPFYSTKRDGTGRGLSLATAYGLVTGGGGGIGVVTEPGKGTRFRLYFPEPAAAPVPAAAAATDLAPLTPAGATVLLAEDEPGVRLVIERMLRKGGYQVISTPDGAEALEAANRGEPFDLLVTDVRMPRCSGPELARTLRAARPGLAVLFISGYTDGKLDDDLTTSTDQTGFLLKPFGSAEFLEVLRNLRGGGE